MNKPVAASNHEWLDLFADELVGESNQLFIEELPTGVALGCWGTFSSFGSAFTCASTIATASTNG